MTPNLLVIRANDIDALVEFYKELGMNFEKHRHGKGPEHYASENEGFVFEIYPVGKDLKSTSGLRFGFKVNSLEEVLAKIERFDYTLVVEPKESPWGRRMVLDDLVGHRIEFIESK